MHFITFPLHPIVDGRCGCGDATCTNIGKHPAERWSQVPADRPMLEPTASRGVGIATGASSGVFVVDLDVKNGIDGRVSLMGMGDVPPTYTVGTPSGGFHLYYQHPGFPVRNSGPKSNPLGAGIDVRGDGGYVVAPGSPHKSGGVYSVAADLPIAPAPAWLLAWPGLRKSDAAKGSEPASEVEARFAHVPRDFRVALAREWLAKQPPAVSGDGGSGATMRCVAGAVRAFALTDAAMALEGVSEWNARCAPPWKGQELAHKIDEALHKSTIPWDTSDVAGLWRLQSHAVEPSPAPIVRLEPARMKTPRLAPAERALRIGGRDVTRLKTGLFTLDAATRGGILLRKLAVIGGAPGAGKTALLVHLAFSWLSQGVAVGILAADEDADGLLIRLGQQIGLSRDALENGDRNARASLANWCNSVPLLLSDGDEDGGTIEELSRDLHARVGSGASAMIVDSMQTARSEHASPKGADMRTKINGTVGALKRSAKVDGHLVIASSELSKAAYRNKDAADNVNALAAFKESGDIEYGVGLALVLTSRAGSSELVDAAVVKNRLGPSKPEFMLRLNHDRADVREATEQDIKATDPAYFIKCGIRTVIDKACGTPTTKGIIADRVGGKRQRVWAAIDEMLEKHELHQDRHGIRYPLPGDPGYPPDP
jgi:RecA/RadA recombinase